jgi:hypothetical protein
MNGLAAPQKPGAGHAASRDYSLLLRNELRHYSALLKQNAPTIACCILFVTQLFRQDGQSGFVLSAGASKDRKTITAATPFADKHQGEDRTT